MCDARRGGRCENTHGDVSAAVRTRRILFVCQLTPIMAEGKRGTYLFVLNRRSLFDSRRDASNRRSFLRLFLFLDRAGGTSSVFGLGVRKIRGLCPLESARSNSLGLRLWPFDW